MNERREQPGLVVRMQRESRVILAQHRQLAEFYARVAAALESGELARARNAFTHFSDALEAHLALEDGLYFPALRGLRPSLEPDLERLCDEHQALREQLARLARSIESGAGGPCARLLQRLAGELAEHEGREEALLASIQTGGNGR